MIYVGQSLRQIFSIGINTSLVDNISLFYKKPDGAMDVIITDIEIEEEETGTYYYDIPVSFLDQAGIWTLWAKAVTTEDQEYFGTPFSIEVLEQGTGKYPITKEQIKSLLGITSSTQDAKIDAYIPILIEQYLLLRNAPFQIKNGVEIYPAGFDVAIAEMYKELKNDASLNSESIGSYSASWKPTINGWSNNVTRLIKKHIRGA